MQTAALLQDDPIEPQAREVTQAPWGRRTLQFLHAWSLMGAGAITLADFAPLFALAPRGELAVTLAALVRLDCLVPLDESSFFVGPRVPDFACGVMR